MTRVVRLAGDCPSCGAELVVRHRRRDGERFISCSAFPGCKWCGDYDDALQTLAAKLEAARKRQSEFDVSRALRDVIVFAHPDRWPDAQELSLGVTMRLSALRDKL